MEWCGPVWGFGNWSHLAYVSVSSAALPVWCCAVCVCDCGLLISLTVWHPFVWLSRLHFFVLQLTGTELPGRCCYDSLPRSGVPGHRAPVLLCQIPPNSFLYPHPLTLPPVTQDRSSGSTPSSTLGTPPSFFLWGQFGRCPVVAIWGLSLDFPDGKWRWTPHVFIGHLDVLFCEMPKTCVYFLLLPFYYCFLGVLYSRCKPFILCSHPVAFDK